MKYFNLKLSIFLCFLILGIGSASAQDGAGFIPVELKTGINNDGNPLSHSGLNNSGWSDITYSGGYESQYPRYNYNITLKNQSNRNYAFELFKFQQSVPAYSRLRLTLRQTWIHQYNLTTAYNVASASTFTVFETESAARTTRLVVDPSTTPYSNPGGGTLYISVTNPGNKSNVQSAKVSKVSYFDNRNGSAQNTIVKWAVLATYSARGSGQRRAYLLVETVGGQYVDKAYDYYKHITFNPNGGKGDMSGQTVENSAAINANTFTRDGFTFAGWNTQPDGTGTNYDNSATITATNDSKGPVTLYAQWTPLPMTVKFDYTFRTSETAGEEIYMHMPETVQSGENPFTNKVRATFYDHNNNKLTSVILTAPAATTPQGTPTDDIATHKTAALTLNVVKGTTESLTNEGPAYTLTLDAAKYAYGSVGFEVMNADATASAAHWVTDEVNATSYLFKYEGHASANMFNLTWRVNLKGLSMYPSDIFAKPMRKGTHTDDGGSTTLEPIPAMQNIKGIECKLAGYIDADNQDVTIEAYNNMTPEQKAALNKKGAYYKGEYNVLKTCAHGKDYNYQLGLTGFNLDGNPYYLAATEGNIPDDMISEKIATPTDVNINYDRSKEQIPVLILSPNGEGATVGGRSNYELYVDNNTNVVEGKRVVSLSKFEALRANYELVGWKDAYDNTEYGVNGIYHFNIGTKATTTLLAQWKRDSAPTATYTIDEVGDNFKYVVTAIDALNDVQSVQYIITETEDVPAADATGWSNMQKQEDGTYTYTFPMLNDNRGKYIWAKAANADKSAIISMGQIRSIIKLQGICDLKSKKEETETIDEIPTTIDYYDYYTTFFFGDRTFKVSNIAYTAKVDGSQLTLMKIDPNDEGFVIIPKGTPVVLKKEQSTADDDVIVLEECDQATTLEDNDLKGVDGATSKGSSDYYIFGENAENDLGFYKNNTGQLEAHKAYFMLEKDEQNPNPEGFKLKDTTFTGINDVNVNGTANGATYDLLGRKVKATNAKSGIYIKDGKKILVK